MDGFFLPFKRILDIPTNSVRDLEEDAMKERVARLLDREAMLARLTAVADIPHYHQNLYPKLLEKAGEELYPTGIVLLLTIAIDEYAQDMSLATKVGVLMFLDRFIDALTDDETARREAKAFAEEAGLLHQ